MEPSALECVVYSHCSAERGHRRMLEALSARPLMNLDMRLGEGTGAAIGVSLVESAIRLYREMATFQSAGVSGGSRPQAGPTSEVPLPDSRTAEVP
jgi:nicotinate-nucleotide--dimethylbenzimidazole phosphoribosyltransferase